MPSPQNTQPITHVIDRTMACRKSCCPHAMNAVSTDVNPPTHAISSCAPGAAAISGVQRAIK